MNREKITILNSVFKLFSPFTVSRKDSILHCINFIFYFNIEFNKKVLIYYLLEITNYKERAPTTRRQLIFSVDKRLFFLTLFLILEWI